MSRTPDQELIARIRQGDQRAWRELVDRYEGRLFAFVRLRVKDLQAAEDLVQDTFLGFLNSLPHYDGRPLENYLFTICAHKTTDFLRRHSRGPAAVRLDGTSDAEAAPLVAIECSPSTMARRDEQQGLEENALAEVLGELIRRWQQRGDWLKLQCIELLVVRGWPNKRVAEQLNLSEQQVANFKFDFIRTMRAQLRRRDLPQDVFPELYEQSYHSQPK